MKKTSFKKITKSILACTIGVACLLTVSSVVTADWQSYNHDIPYTVPNSTPTATLTVSASSVSYGGAVDIHWQSTNSSYCVGDNFSTGNATYGDVTVSNLTQSKTFTVTCYN